MKFLLALLPLLGAVHCGAIRRWSDNYCMSDADAQSFVDRSIVFLEHLDVQKANETAQGLFDDNIQEFGDSINSLRGDALGTQVENGKAKYIAETLATPPIPSIDTIAIIHDCSNIAWFWSFNGIGSGEYRVHGVTRIQVNSKGLIYYQQVEFNSIAWGLDLGFQVIPAALPGS